MYRLGVFLLSIGALLAMCPTFEAKCPMGAVQGPSSDTCYIYKLVPKLWFEAQIDCGKFGGKLTSAHNSIMSSFLAGQMSGTCFSDYWVGGSNIFGTWAWADGTQWDFTNWAAGQPEGSGALCLALETGSDSAQLGLWFSFDCNKPLPYICSVPAIPDKKSDEIFDFISHMTEKNN
ncbi:perlucin B protein precursor [Aphelenchoides avenae]|nr:perlucin B protein precursor [Aphelenchus avenae]